MVALVLGFAFYPVVELSSLLALLMFTADFVLFESIWYGLWFSLSSPDLPLRLQQALFTCSYMWSLLVPLLFHRLPCLMPTENFRVPAGFLLVLCPQTLLSSTDLHLGGTFLIFSPVTPISLKSVCWRLVEKWWQVGGFPSV